jgi:hypothetical protein
MMVLNVTTSEATMNRMIALTGELSGKGNTYLCFRTSDQFGRYFKPPRPMDELMTGEWQRAGYPPFHIDRP